MNPGALLFLEYSNGFGGLAIRRAREGRAIRPHEGAPGEAGYKDTMFGPHRPLSRLRVSTISEASCARRR